jgi:hypothetical protein
MFWKTVVDAELSRSLGLTMKEIEPILAVGGDSAEKQFMECCWCLWKADGIELVDRLSKRLSIFCLRNPALFFFRGC